MATDLQTILAQKDLVTEHDVARAREIQDLYGGSMGEILMRLGAVGEADVLSAQQQQLGLDIFSPDNAPTDLQTVTNAMAAIAPISWWLQQGAVAWRDPLDNRFICIARDPLAPALHEAFENSPDGETPRFFLAYGKDIDFMIQSIKDFQKLGQDFSLEFDGASIKELGEDAPIIEFINKAMSQAVYSGASDIHFEPGESRFIVRFRIDGVLSEHSQQPLDIYDAVVSRIKLLSGLDIAERRLPQDGRQTVRAAGQAYDLRVSTLPGVLGESIVIRLLSKNQEKLTLDHLGFLPSTMAAIRAIVHRPNGIFLVTGPTGSGKSTTLQAALLEINDGERKIITVEDPVEYNIDGMVQVQVKAEIDLTFAKALRSILRQDPDVIMIGEIRDRETANIAIESALTGHMVFSTLHTNNAIGAVTRLLNMGIEPFMLGAALEGIMAQRLVRRLCKRCAQPTTRPPESAQNAALLTGVSQNWHKAVGCDHCSNTGYRGRIGVYELIRITTQLRNNISANVSENELANIVVSEGQHSLRDDGLIKAALGLTTLDEIARVIGETSSAQ